MGQGTAHGGRRARLDYRPYLQAILAGEQERATALITQLALSGQPLRRIYLEVLQPALQGVGDAWQERVVTVAEEHMATAIAQSTMAHLMDPRYVLAPRRKELSLIGVCPEIERHDIGLRMFCDLAALDGWEVYFLGASVPMPSIIEIVLRFRPDVLALSATLTGHVAQLAELIRDLRTRISPLPTLVVGGLAFNEHPEQAATVNADVVVRDAGQGIDWLNSRYPVGV